MKDLTDKVAVVTGGASGVGLGIVKALLAEGAKVVISDVNQNGIDEAVENLDATVRSRAVGKMADVSSIESVNELRDFTLQTFGQVDLIFNNAGVSTWETIDNLTLEQWKWVLDVNLYGVINGIHSFLPILLEQGTPSRIVNTASPAALISTMPFQAPYAVSKSAVITLSETLQAEMAMKQVPIGVTVVLPGQVTSNIMNCKESSPFKDLPLSEAASQYHKHIVETLKQQPMSAEDFGKTVIEAIKKGDSFVASHKKFFKDLVVVRNERVVDQAFC